jgi:hypothetical protein
MNLKDLGTHDADFIRALLGQWPGVLTDERA